MTSHCAVVMGAWAALPRSLSACIALLLLLQRCAQAQAPGNGRHVEYEYTLGGNSPDGGQTARQQQYRPGILDQPGYDCKENVEHCTTQWTDAKRVWCEDTAHSHCYDCRQNREHCTTQWSFAQRVWCEDTAHMPCQDKFQCDLGLEGCHEWWDPKKKLWCEQHKGVICEPPATTTTVPTTTTAAPTTTTTPAPTTTTTLPTTTTPLPTTTTTLPPTTTTTPASTITFTTPAPTTTLTTPAPTTTTTLAITTTTTLPPTITITTLLPTETTTTATAVPTTTETTTRVLAIVTSTTTEVTSTTTEVPTETTLANTFTTTTMPLTFTTTTTTMTKTALLAQSTAAATAASTSLSQVPKAPVTSSGAHGLHGESSGVSLSLRLRNVRSSVILTKPEVLSQVSKAVQAGIAVSIFDFFQTGNLDSVSVSMSADTEPNTIRVLGTIDPGKTAADTIRKKLNNSIDMVQSKTAMQVSNVPDISSGTVTVTDVHIFATEIMHWHCSAPADILAKPDANSPPTGQKLQPDTVFEVAKEVGYFLELADGRGWVAIGKHGLQCERYSLQEEQRTPAPPAHTSAPTTTTVLRTSHAAHKDSALPWVRGKTSAAATSAPPAISSEPAQPTPVHPEPHDGGPETGGHNQGGHEHGAQDRGGEHVEVPSEGHQLEEPHGHHGHGKEVVSSSLTVTNVDYAKLEENTTIVEQFKNAIRSAIADVARVPADAVAELRLSAGSVRVHTIIRLPEGESSGVIADRLHGNNEASTLGDAVLAKLESVSGLKLVKTGEMQVTAVEASPARLHNKHHGHWSHGKHQHEYTTVEKSVAVLLIGVVSFVLVMFYLVNYKDNDIRLYSWSIISATVCIFTSVLCFKACKDCLSMCLGDAPEGVRLATCFVLVLGIFAALQLTTAVISGTVCEGRGVNLAEEVWVIADNLHSGCGTKILEHQVRHKAGKHGVADIQAQAIFVSKERTELDQRVRKMKCFASLLTYACGFAAIDAGGTLQQIEPFSRSPIWAVMPIVISQVFLVTLFGLFRLVHDFHLPSRGTLKRDHREMLWEHECHESETQIASLSASFLLVQALRFHVSGVMPDKNGIEKNELWTNHKLEHVLKLYAWGLGSAAISVVLGLIVHKKCSDSETSTLRCCLHVIQSTTGMVFAWCIIWATRWEALRLPELREVQLQPGSMAMPYQILLAMTVSVLSILLIFIFDVIEDICGPHGVMGGLTQSVISTLSLLVGFAWQRCFQEAVKSVAVLSPRPYLMELVVSLIVVILVVPAWQRYILRKEYYYRKISREKRDAATKPSTIAGSESSVDRFDTSTMVSSEYKELGMPMRQPGTRAAGRVLDGRGMGPCSPDVRSVGPRRGGYMALESTDEHGSGHRMQSMQNGMSPYTVGQASDY